MYRYKDANVAGLERLVKGLQELVQKIADEDEKTLFKFTKEDVDGVIENLDHEATDEQREDCYGRVSEIDCSSIFDHIDIICQMAMSDKD